MYRKFTFLALAVFAMALVGVGCDREIPTSLEGGLTSDEGLVTGNGLPDSLAENKSNTLNLQDKNDYGLMDWGCINYPINPWLPLGGYSFGRYVSGRGYHLGDDCVRNAGTSVYAIYNGYVRYARYNSGGWGYLMIVESTICGIPFCTVYGHLGATMYPGEGNNVCTGQYIGTVGSTGESGQSPPHLHLGIHYGSYGAPTGTYPSWCRGYGSSTANWYNPTEFIGNW